MKEKELLDRLAIDLDGYTLLPAKTSKYSKGYNPSKDKRLTELLSKDLDAPVALRQRLELISYTIISGLCRYSLNVPSFEQMNELFDIAEITPNGMNSFVTLMDDYMMSSFGGAALKPLSVLFHYVLWDSLCESCGIVGIPRECLENLEAVVNRKVKQHVKTPGSMGRCNKFIDYLLKNEILTLKCDEESAMKEYDDFFYKNTLITARQHVTLEEQFILDDEMSRTGGKFGSLLKKKDPMKYMRLMNSGDDVLNVLKFDDIPQELIPHRDAYLKAMQNCEEANQKARELFTDEAEHQAKYMEEVVAEDLAEATLLAITRGDECYKLNVAGRVINLLGNMLGVPGSIRTAIDLDDEDEWDYDIHPADNGDLAEAIIGVSDLTAIGNESLKMYSTTSGMIADLAECQFSDGLYIRKSIVKFFERMGYKKRQARELAVVVATLQHTRRQEMHFEGSAIYSPMTESEHTSKEEVKATATNNSGEVVQLKKNLETAERIRKSMDRESQKLRHEIADFDRQKEAYEDEIAKLKAELEKRDLILDEIGEEEEPETEAVNFPYHTDLNVVVYGGFPVFHTELQKLIPGIRILEAEAHLDLDIVRNADVLFMQVNRTGHSGYWAVRDAAKEVGVPYYHLRYASAKRCAEMMVGWIEGLKK